MTSHPSTTGQRRNAHRPRLLLINPRFPESFWSFRWALQNVLPGKRTLNPPLGLATLAALCPANWQVQIIDEAVESIPLDPEVDIIGICGMAVQFHRQQELLGYYRRKGYHVVAGGSYASLCPERYEKLADTVIAGEAEYIWPQFCHDFEQQCPRPLYREQGVVNLADSPTPRFDLLKLDHYTSVSLQFSRGCPYRCEFCDIIVMFGRRPRTKHPEQIARELDALRQRGVRNVFFVDDNLVGNKRKAKELLRYLASYQKRHRYQFLFGTEASLNAADDDELLRLFRAANFGWLFIGIESPDEESLKEIKKTQNTRRDMLVAVRNCYRYGIDVLAGFIVGFDNDRLQTFERQYRFILESGIQVAMIGLLNALPRTPLYERLEREGRLIPGAAHADNTKPGTNFVPKRMTYDAMVDAYQHLYQRLLGDGAIACRIRNKMRLLRRPVPRVEYSPREAIGIVVKLLVYGVLPGGPMRLARFLWTLTMAAPRGWPQVISDWIAGLALQDYVRRYFVNDALRRRRAADATLRFIGRRYASCLGRGALGASVWASATATRLAITLRGTVDSTFFKRAPRQFEKLLRTSATTLVFRIEEFSEQQSYQLDRLLGRLAHHGDRVCLKLDRQVRQVLTIDLSRFHLILDDA
ncbi:MAG: radical SAM protein [Acidiferrobacterales bacterium]